MTLRDRLRWVLENRGKNASKLSVAAGLARGHISLILNDEERDVSLSVIERIATAANVSPAWLAVGYGSPDDVRQLPRELADTIQVGQRWSPWTIEAVVRLALTRGRKRTVAEWASVLDRWEAAHKPLVESFDSANLGNPSTSRLKV